MRRNNSGSSSSKRDSQLLQFNSVCADYDQASPPTTREHEETNPAVTLSKFTPIRESNAYTVLPGKPTTPITTPRGRRPRYPFVPDRVQPADKEEMVDVELEDIVVKEPKQAADAAPTTRPTSWLDDVRGIGARKGVVGAAGNGTPAFGSQLQKDKKKAGTRGGLKRCVGCCGVLTSVGAALVLVLLAIVVGAYYLLYTHGSGGSEALGRCLNLSFFKTIHDYSIPPAGPLSNNTEAHNVSLAGSSADSALSVLYLDSSTSDNELNNTMEPVIEGSPGVESISLSNSSSSDY